MPAGPKCRKALAILLVPVALLTLFTLVLHNSSSRPPSSPALWDRYDVRGRAQSNHKICKTCLQSPDVSITIVAARSNEDTSWLDVYLGRIRHIVYQIIDANAEHTTAVNKGNEAMPYLQYIIDHYEQLPDVSVFSHGAM